MSASGVPNPDNLYRVLRLAVRYELLGGAVDKARGKVTFRNNALSAVLRSDHPNTVQYASRRAWFAITASAFVTVTVCPLTCQERLVVRRMLLMLKNSTGSPYAFAVMYASALQSLLSLHLLAAACEVAAAYLSKPASVLRMHALSGGAG
jgi:hypothetical protein